MGVRIPLVGDPKLHARESISGVDTVADLEGVGLSLSWEIS